MKISTLRALSTLSLDPETLSEIQAEIVKMEKAEARKDEQKAAKNAEYAEAHDVIMGVIADAVGPVTIAEIYEACKDELPEGFTKNKISYALRVYWSDEVVKTEGKVNTYAKA